MSSRELPARPNREHLKNQARKLLRQDLEADASAIARFAAFGVTSAKPRLADALHVIAREHGFDTWPALKLHLDAASADPVEALIAAIKANDASLVLDVLTLSQIEHQRTAGRLCLWGAGSSSCRLQKQPRDD